MVTENARNILSENGHASRLLMSRLLSGDLEQADRDALAAHVNACAHCGATFARARDLAAQFVQKHPTLDSLAAGRRAPRAAQPAPGLWERLLGAVDRGFGFKPALAFAALVIVSVGVLWTIKDRQTVPDLTAKGTAHFYLVLNGDTMLSDTVGCGPTDTLQLGITSAAPVYYAVLYRDDGGKIQPYMEGESESGQPLGAPHGENLPHSLVMESGWFLENLYCVWSDKPFTLADAEALIQGGGKPASPALHLQLFLLKNIRT